MQNMDERSAGGKVTRSKRPPATPYSRPHKPWLSRLVSPARTLISGIPSFFSKPLSDDTVFQEQNQSIDEAKEDEAPYTDMNIDSKPVEDAAICSHKTYAQDGISDIANMSDIDPSRPSNFDEIEKFVSSKNFSRDDAQRLLEILRSRSVDSKETRQDGDLLQERATGEARLLPHQPSCLGDNSPVEIARAYMKSRISETSPSRRNSLQNEQLSGKNLTLTPSPSPSTCWRGAISQEICHGKTSHGEKRKFGLSTSQRTPYSKSIYSNTRSQIQDFGARRFDLASSSTKTKPFADKGNSSGNIFHESESFGPIRRTRHHTKVETPTNFRTFRSSSISPVEDSKFPSLPFSGMNKNIEPRNSSSSNVGVPPHSSHLARKILEHLDRNPPTPKEKAAELKQATSWRQTNDASNQHNSSSIQNDSSLKLSEPTEAEPFLLHKIITKPASGSVSGSKPVLPAISINKQLPSWAVSSDNGVGFTFPVSTSSGSPHELPTPSITPIQTTSAVHSDNNGLPAPSYSFGKTTSTPLTFSFPSISQSLDQSNPVKLNFPFAENTQSRIAFSSIGNDAVYC